MPDEMDRVQDMVLNELEHLTARRLSQIPHTSPKQLVVFCARCGEVIDPRRVQAVAGVRRCVRCEGIAEHQMGRHIR